MDICIDFDGTCVAHEFPKIGKDIGAVPVLKELVEKGHNLILFTMRSDRKKTKNLGNEVTVTQELLLTDAVHWFEQNGIKLYGIQSNPKQQFWTKSPKAYGNIYIDDAALGCPLIVPEEGRAYVDWAKVRELLMQMNVL